MLEELRITALGVIEESVLEVGPGFTAITGETGAGKTMVVTALGLLLGARADAGVVRTGAKHTRVEGLVRVPAGVAERIQEIGGDVDDDCALLVRQVAAEGRSRAFAGAAAVPVGTLGELASSLLAIHGQSDQHRLLQPAAQRDALDRFAGLLSLRAEFERGYARLRTVETELTVLRDNARERAREADLLRFGLGEIEAVAPVAGEDVALAEEESRLAHADTLRGAAEQARESLSADEGADALGAVALARKLLDGVRDHDPRVGALVDRLAEVGYLLADLAADLASYVDDVEVDPARLAVVSERRAALQGLTRKYGDDLTAVLSWAQESATRLLELDDSDDRILGLEAERKQLQDELARLGGSLSQQRSQAAEKLGAIITSEIGQLAMPHASVVVEVTTGDHFGPTGYDDVAFLLAANSGATPRPLAKGASGGELSRVMLGLEVALAETDPVPTFVFDEVDAGIGGRAAVEVGRRLASLAKHAQVIVVTHLPQVAAFADQHVVVHKSDEGTITRSGLTALDDDARVLELSRMLAGLEGSDSARAHAEELLAQARSHRDA